MAGAIGSDGGKDYGRVSAASRMTESRRDAMPHVFILLLNWNGWRDTIECLESVFRLNYPSFSVIVCDNASTDGSLERIENWANGEIAASCTSPELPHLVVPPVPKPIPFIRLSTADSTALDSTPAVPLVLIQTGSNLGFAGGNNVGIRFALGHVDCAYVWLLNNDTVIESDALSALVATAEADPKLGICGSVLRSYASPREILTVGGRRYSRWSGRTRPITDLTTPTISTLPGAPDYVEGASMLISRSCLEQTGFLDESYFLYFEELDYVFRARPAFHFGYASNSVVYHKEGASIGSAMVRAKRSVLSDFYLARNRLIFTGRYYPRYVPSVLAAVGVSALQRIMIGRPRNAVAILHGARAPASPK